MTYCCKFLEQGYAGGYVGQNTIVAEAMRQGEILALEWKHVDVERHTAFLPDTKNGTSRTVPLSPAAVALTGSSQIDLIIVAPPTVDRRSLD